MASDELEAVRERAWDIFTYRCPPLLRFGEKMYRAVESVVDYAYVQGQHDCHCVNKEQNKLGAVRAVYNDHRALLGHLLTLATSGVGASLLTTLTAATWLPGAVAAGGAVLALLLLVLRSVLGGTR